MFAGPEMARLIEEFNNLFLENKDDDNFHHDALRIFSTKQF